MITLSEQNYLKGIYHLQNEKNASVNTNELANYLSISAASVTEMIKRLSNKSLVTHEKYRGVCLTGDGLEQALQVIRRHRLWEFFLVEKLRFSWDKVHEIAEELEHINSFELFDRLEEFLGQPEFDPHGDPIPNKFGKLPESKAVLMSDLSIGSKGKLVGVKDQSSEFYNYLEALNLRIGDQIELKEFIDYDNSCLIESNGTNILLSRNAIKYLRVVIK